jgi:hypothetical protein
MRWAGGAALAATLVMARSASAATVLAIDAGDLVVDVGAARGAADGQRVEIWRPFKVRHPVTGAVLTDRFRLGTLRLTQVQSTLALARADGELLRPPAVGDVVVAPEPVARIEEPRHAEAKPEPPRAEPQILRDPEEHLLAELLASQASAPPAKRAEAYETFVREHPLSRYVPALSAEIGALRALAAPPPLAIAEPAVPHFEHARAHEYAIELDPRFKGAVLHVRTRGEPAYRSFPMRARGPRYWGVVLPAAAIASPGVEYFAEGVLEDGQAVPIAGTADAPRDAVVNAPAPKGKRPETLAHVAVQSEYASFNVKRANDWLFQTEGAFTWRLADVGVRALRSGFGVLRGRGGSVEALDRLNESPTQIGLTYGYLEMEVAPASGFALIGRPILGLRERGISGGAQGFVRFGNDLKTNLLVGGEILGEIGIRGIVQLDWRTIDRVPIVLRTEVTNLPAGEDIGARAIGQVGYELLKNATLAARVSYQGRTINHAGPGAGLAASYLW